MAADGEGLGAVIGGFLDAAHRVAPHRLAELIESTARDLGATSARIWLVDHQQRVLMHLPAGEAREQPLLIDATAAGRAFIAGEALDAPPRPDGTHHRYEPLIDGVDRMGVLELDVGELTPDDVDRYRHLASVATAELVTRGQYGDVFTQARRRRPLTLAAEIQWQGLPPGSFTTGGVAVAGMLEPAYEVGGETFDYAHAADVLDLLVLDAVGHDLGASVISSLAVASYRHNRRSGGSMIDAATLMDATLRQQIGRGAFATGQLGRLDTATGRLRWLNAGHPLPLLVRMNRIEELPCRPRPPFGLGDADRDRLWEIAEVQLEPGDAVFFYTDGVTEAQQIGAEEFGLDRLKDFLHAALSADLAPAETLRRLSVALLDFHEGDLRDDATTFLVQWRPPTPGR